MIAAIDACFYLAPAEREEATAAIRRVIGQVAGSRWEALCEPLLA